MAWDPDQGRKGFGAHLFRLRSYKLRLSQAQFADRFGLTLGAVKDLEQSRTAPTRAVRILIAAIEQAPDVVATAAGSVRDELDAAKAAKAGHRWGRAASL